MILSNGGQTLQALPGQPYRIAHLTELNYNLWLPDGPHGNETDLFGTNVLYASGMYAGPVVNYGTLVEQSGSNVAMESLAGAGAVVAVGSQVYVGGSGSATEAVGLVNGSKLSLGLGLSGDNIQFLSTVFMDKTSEIDLVNPDICSFLTSNYAQGIIAQDALHGIFEGICPVHSLTQGYAPVLTFNFGSNGQALGATITDKPIIAGQHS